MITSEIKVNGVLIAHIYCINISPVFDFDDTYIYRGHIYNVKDGKTKNFDNIIHNRSDGWEVLFLKILKECN